MSLRPLSDALVTCLDIDRDEAEKLSLHLRQQDLVMLDLSATTELVDRLIEAVKELTPDLVTEFDPRVVAAQLLLAQLRGTIQ